MTAFILYVSATQEELQSANEEVRSSNEELQSINEELKRSTASSPTTGMLKEIVEENQHTTTHKIETRLGSPATITGDRYRTG